MSSAWYRAPNRAILLGTTSFFQREGSGHRLLQEVQSIDDGMFSVYDRVADRAICEATMHFWSILAIAIGVTISPAFSQSNCRTWAVTDDGFVVCNRLDQPRSKDTRTASGPVIQPPTAKSTSTDQLYRLIMSFLNAQTMTRGKFSGQKFGPTYAAVSPPKALVVCLDWSTTRPDRIKEIGLLRYQFVSGDGSRKPRSVDEAKRYAIEDLKQARGGCSVGVPVLVDANGKNMLAPPPAWLEQHR